MSASEQITKADIEAAALGEAIEGVEVPDDDQVNAGAETAIEGEVIEAEEVIDDEQAAAMLSQLIQITAAIVCPAWGLQPAECDQLAGAYIPVINKYWPGMEIGPEATAIIVTGAIIGPRLGKPRKVENGGKDGDQSENEPTQ